MKALYMSQYELEDQQNHAYLKEKYDKKTIVFYSGPSFEKWNYNSCETKGIGGSETWAIKLSEEFAKLGYRVLNFADCSIEGKFNGVNWIHYSKLHDYIEYNYFDCFISSRTTEPFKLKIRSDKKLVICHDIWLNKNKIVPYQEKVDKFLCLSDWHRQFVCNHHGFPLDKVLIVSNGIDITRYKQEVERQPYRLIWSSSLDRGLDTLLYLFDFVKVNIPELELHIFYGIDNWEKTVVYKPAEKQKIENIKRAMNKPGVFYHGRVGQDRLAEEQLKSSLWCYPTTFTETWCITAIEMMAAGVPIICSNLAALTTTVGDCGILIGNGNINQALTRDCRIQFAHKIIEILKNKEIWKYWSVKGKERAKQFTWKNAANDFIKKIGL
ncbi:MAG: glycosyltransferase family 4 protein [Candidatus Nanoarchaeia archaeon]|nr:glycosyltransferase family 4 protein [Candidatus Nanoarchaeia archaeon]